MSEYARRIQTCIGCDRSGAAKEACGLDGLTLHDHAKGAACQEGLLSRAAVSVTVGGVSLAAEAASATSSTGLRTAVDLLAEARLGACRGCDQFGGVVRAGVVKCGLSGLECGCKRLTGTCDRWAEADAAFRERRASGG